MKAILDGRKIVLGVTGSIAAYKALELVRLFAADGAKVKVVMTRGAQEFIRPLSFEALSGEPVFYDTFSTSHGGAFAHIEIASDADCIVIAPATANIIGKMASGIADDPLTTVVTATRAPVVIAPAMNEGMYKNPIVEENIHRLKGLGYLFVGPEEGGLACGYEGMGRMSEPEDIRETVISTLTQKDLAGIRVIVTAGPTREFIDPVRFISNPSTGRMGFSVARVAKRRGADVVLIYGETGLKSPSGIEAVPVTGVEDMRSEVLSRLDSADLLIMAAAVGDFTPSYRMERKIKKKERLALELVPTPDILREAGERKGGCLLVGFAAETDDVIDNARKKLVEKNLDLIVANDILAEVSGFGSDTNRVVIIDRDSVDELPLLTKEEIAYILLDRVVEALRCRKGDRVQR